MSRASRSVLKPDRVRKIEGSFAFIEHRFMREGFFESLEKAELHLYFFLVLVGDRHGLSWYAYDRICSMLRLTVDEYIEARNELIRKDLIAFDGHLFQVLSLPQKPPGAARRLLKTEEDMERHDPATVQQLIASSLGIRQEG
ncbi:MAG: hypothetical protein EHM36_07145 [Deltaproteobacteria bacterium]|nr:MAG: hypothetical protein EHM36_07145 [Deltaproteobacteria bacterium]